METGISFTDLDLDFQDLAGDVSWLQPSSRDFVSTYAPSSVRGKCEGNGMSFVLG